MLSSLFNRLALHFGLSKVKPSILNFESESPTGCYGTCTINTRAESTGPPRVFLLVRLSHFLLYLLY
jgi:hypothetical protein